MKTKDIIKILPLDEKTKMELLDRYDNLDPDVKARIIDLLWDTYDAMYDLKFEENMQLALYRAKEGKEKLDQELGKRIQEQTEKEIEKEVIEGKQTVDLAAARSAMERIIAEIRASKKR
ncbi:hypothetical protein C4559_01410 [Candidatus Microgenomates bacterium]|nr:MAG: hypothetical protein C4559_01410 [Candidatus Microgenomates bacterium]